MEKQLELKFEIINKSIKDPYKCGVCKRDIKKPSEKMAKDPDYACGICRLARKEKKIEEKLPPKATKEDRKKAQKAVYEEEQKKKREEEYNIPNCLASLANEPYLWDMRAWHKYKDRDEVGAYVDNPTHKNSGSAQFLVERLKFLSVDKELIIQAIMDNPKITWKDRIYPCMAVEENLCPLFIENGKNYGSGICNECQGKPKIMKFEIVTSRGNKVQVSFDRAFNYHFEFCGESISNTGYRSHFLGFGNDINLPDIEIPEFAKKIADKLEIEEEIEKLKREKKEKRGGKKKCS